MSNPPRTALLRLEHVLAAAVALIFVQTLFFKFTGAPESVFIFETLGAEPFGRIASGVAELIAAVLILVPATRHVGALLSAGVISGAIGAHLTVLGIEVQGDGGLLFGLAVTVFVASSAVLLLRRAQLTALVNRVLLRRRPTAPRAV